MGVQKYVYNCELYYYLLIIVLFICIVCLFHMNNCKPIFAYPCVLSYLHQNVYSSFIHYSQNLEVTQIAINKKVNKQIEDRDFVNICDRNGHINSPLINL